MGCVMLLFLKGDSLLVMSTMMYNYALGFSCFHTLIVNTRLLPQALKPGLFIRVVLVLAGCFFTGIAGITTAIELPKLLETKAAEVKG